MFYSAKYSLKRLFHQIMIDLYISIVCSLHIEHPGYQLPGAWFFVFKGGYSEALKNNSSEPVLQ